MATSLLRLGRLGSLKCLQQDGWGCLRTPLTATFCTKAEAPKKPAKKASTAEAPDERAALLAYKTTVAFPARLSTPGFLSQGVALGEYEQRGEPVTNAPTKLQVSAEASSKESVTPADANQAESVPDGSAETKSESPGVVAAAETATEKGATSADVEAPKDDDGTSSSSSSSDSESDSDSDDEKPDETEIAKPNKTEIAKPNKTEIAKPDKTEIAKPDKTEIAEPAAQAEDKPGQEEKPSAVGKKLAPDTKTEAVPEHVQPSAPKRAVKEAPQITKAEQVPVPSAASEEVLSDEICDPAPVLRTAESVKARAEFRAGVAVKSSEVSDAKPELAKGTPDVAAKLTPEVNLDPATQVVSEPEAEIQAAPETAKTVAAAEGLADTARLITDAEVVAAEPEVTAAPEEAAAVPAPEPEPEPFDNTTYKNLQHHNYNSYTFVDVDVEMVKYRLPQPSTGRPSPRH